MNLQDKEDQMKGIFKLQVHNRKGELVEEYEHHNLIMNAGRFALANLLGNSGSNNYLGKIGVGTNGTSPSTGDTALTGGFTKALTSVTVSSNTVTCNYVFDYSEANGIAIQEFGLFTQGNTLFARRTRAAINKTSDLRLSGTWQIIF